MVRVLTHPFYHEIDDVLKTSRQMCQIVKESGQTLVGSHWTGNLDSLPEVPAIVHASYLMHCTFKEFGSDCAGRGHLPVFHDHIVMPDGTLRNSSCLAEKTAEFLNRHKDFANQ